MRDGAPWAEMLHLWNAYRRAPLGDRLFVLTRLAVCPWSAVIEALPHTGRILDVGCGRGLLAALIRRHRPALTYTGVDVSGRVVETARRTLADHASEFHTIDAASGRALGRFDCIVLVDVLYAVGLSRCRAAASTRFVRGPTT